MEEMNEYMIDSIDPVSQSRTIRLVGNCQLEECMAGLKIRDEDEKYSGRNSWDKE